MRGLHVTIVSGSHDPSSRELIRHVRTSHCFRLATLPPSCTRNLRTVRGSRTSVLLRVPHNFRGTRTGKRDPVTLVTIGAIGNAGNKLNDTCLRRVLGPSSSRSSIHCQFGPCLGCGMFVIPTLVAVVLILLYNFLPTLGIMDRGRTNAVRRVGIDPIDHFAFALTGLLPC